MNAKEWDLQYTCYFDQLPWIKAEAPINVLQDFVRMLPGSRNVLDYGCGDGRLSKILLQLMCHMTCIDISEQAVRLCKENLSGIADVRYGVADAPIQIAGHYDGIICWNTIHHIPDSEQLDFVEGLYQKLTPHGILLVSGFNIQDDQFQNKSIRISPTTNAWTYAIDDKFFVGSKLTNKVCLSGMVELTDGITNRNRLIQYFFLKAASN